MAPQALGCVGYIDESIHDKPGIYLLAVVFAKPDLAQDVARTLPRLVPTCARPHWHGEDGTTRLALARAVSSLPVTAASYECAFESPGRKEAARARALRWLASELPAGVRCLVLDQRQEKQDAIDRRVLRGLAGRPPRFTVRHASSAKEALLWLPDIVAGAVAALSLGRTGDFVGALSPVLEVMRAERSIETPQDGLP